MGGARDARPPPHPRAVRARAAAGRPAHRRVPPRHDRDRQPDANAEGRRRRSGPGGLQPAVDQGRCRGRARRGIRDRHVRPARRGSRHVLRPSQQRRRHPAADHDGRRLRPRLAPAQRAPGPGGGRPRRHRGDDHRRDPAQGDGRRRRARVPGRRRERGPDQAPVRQPLRHRPEHPRWDPAGDQHPHRRPQGSRRRVRLGRQGHRVPDGRPWRPCGGGGSRSDPRPRGAHGRVRRHVPRRGRRLG